MFDFHHPIEVVRRNIAQGGYTSAAILADYLCDASDTFNDSRLWTLGEVLREWQNVQMNVRTSPEERSAFLEKVKALNELFKTPGRKDVKGFILSRSRLVETVVGFFSEPLGPYYTQLNVTLNYLDEHPELLDQEPVRTLHIEDANHPEKLITTVRNYRMVNIEELFIHTYMPYLHLGGVIEQINGPMLKVINIRRATYIDQVARMIAFYLYNAKNIRRGCKLVIRNLTFTK